MNNSNWVSSGSPASRRIFVKTTRLGSGGFSQPQAVEPQAGEAPQTLYHLDQDPGETTNLYFAHPEVVKELAGLLEQYQQQGYSRPLKKAL